MTHTLLLADDSITIQRVIELTFSGEDIEVLSVGDGESAVECLQSDRPDIVLADISMPKRNGYDVAAYIRSQPAFAAIPVLLLAGAFETVDQARAEQVGCDGVLVKPFEPQQVVARVRELLARADVAKRRAARRAASPAPAGTEASPPTPGVDGDGQAASQETSATAPVDVPASAAAEVRDADADGFVDHGADARPAPEPEPAIGQWFASELDADVPAAVAAAMDATDPSRVADAPEAVLPASPPAPGATETPAEATAPVAADSLEDYFGRLGSAVEAFGASGRGSYESRGVGTTFDDPWTYGEVPTVSRVLEPSPGWQGASRTTEVSGGDRQTMARDAFAPEQLTDDEPLAPRDAGAASSFIADAFHALLASEQGHPRDVEPRPVPVVPMASGQDISEELVERVTQRVIERLVPHAAREMVAGIVSDVAERLVREEIARSRTRAEGRP